MKQHVKLANKRIKVTRTGKLLRRKSGQSHFRAKKSQNALRRKKNTLAVSSTTEKTVRALL
ncbi:MAG: 50S ribosomal protein L35 [Patescibacteria group bacterium]|nr:50S ribosomal protein L35 [Patescibacteria group bacterium]MDE2438237.1 50S ribosomal protein L35 [Patescibacteria group bacterium]